ncbi:UNVERIFIED_ORG: glycosyltransferase involved in cell wall biosynthesis [Gordonia westfalica J30]
MRRVIVDQIDLKNLVPGGTDTCISDILAWGDLDDPVVVGITNDPTVRLGCVINREFRGRTVKFIPVSRFSRDRTARRLRIPDSLKLVFGALRFRKVIPRHGVIWQVHRIEVGFAALLLFRPTRLVQFVHNAASGLSGENSDSAWKGMGGLYSKLESFVGKRANGIIVFNQGDGERLARVYDRVMPARTWYDESVFYPRDMQEPEGAAGDFLELRVLWVGRLEAQKDPNLAIEVFASLRKQDKHARLVVVGDGSLLPAVQSRAIELGVHDDIEFAGSLSRTDVADQMRRSDCLLMTSHYEGSPRVLVEAGACGLPVVATFEADPDHVINSGVNGFVSGRDPVGLAQCVEKVKLSCTSNDCVEASSARSASRVISSILAVGVDDGPTS